MLDTAVSILCTQNGRVLFATPRDATIISTREQPARSPAQQHRAAGAPTGCRSASTAGQLPHHHHPHHSHSPPPRSHARGVRHLSPPSNPRLRARTLCDSASPSCCASGKSGTSRANARTGRGTTSLARAAGGRTGASRPALRCPRNQKQPTHYFSTDVRPRIACAGATSSGTTGRGAAAAAAAVTAAGAVAGTAAAGAATGAGGAAAVRPPPVSQSRPPIAR